MSSTTNDHTIVLDTSCSSRVWAVTFQPDGKHLLSGSDDGARQWRVADGQEVGMQREMELSAICVSKDHKWIVYGTVGGASVWDAKTKKKAIEVEGTNYVGAVDISPDSTRFATGTGIPDNKVNIWDIKAGERLVGPLQHDEYIAGLKFSPNGEHIAIAVRDRSIHILDSRTGDQLVTTEVSIPSGWAPMTPLAWSNDGIRIFVASGENKIKAFDASTVSQLAELQVHSEGEVVSIALAANGKFLATFTGSSVSFWDASTLTQIGPDIDDGEGMHSIALSPDCSYLATGGFDGRIRVRNLSDILPDLYIRPFFHTAIPEETDPDSPEERPQQQRAEQPSTSEIHDKKAPDSTPEQPTTSSLLELEACSKISDNDSLEAAVPTSVPAPLFDYDEPPSPPSHLRAVDATPPEGCPEEHRNTTESSGGIMAVKRWLQTAIKRNVKSQGSRQPDFLSIKPGRPASPRSRSNSQTRGNPTDEGPSRMAAGQRVRRVVAKPVIVQSKTNKKVAEAIRPKTDTSGSGRDANSKTAAPQVDNALKPSAATGFHVTKEAGDARVSIAFKLPSWMCCFSTSTEDGRH